ncbi:MAG: bifunctional DNA-formamidopyrimidine glycosylase/DNA-(apurinic or apyrimidinic site) lyase [Gammaproteobacteria bacterium]
MPELPEVETTRRGIAPYVIGETISNVIVRERQLRWPIPASLKRSLTNSMFRKLERRAKYLLFETEKGCMLLHLGMSGSLRIIDAGAPHTKHDHVDFVFDSGRVLRFRDPRKFGSIHWVKDNPFAHSLLQHLGPEPLSDEFNVDYLFSKSRKRTQSVKTFIMDSRIVVGVGNIYANESLFMAGINPMRKAGSISKARYALLVEAIKAVLESAIRKGGTTLRDFINGEGKPGYFRNELKVYDRALLPCVTCQRPLKLARLGQRATVYCTHCQR